jgi:hypothetical protein
MQTLESLRLYLKHTAIALAMHSLNPQLSVPSLEASDHFLERQILGTLPQRGLIFSI